MPIAEKLIARSSDWKPSSPISRTARLPSRCGDQHTGSVAALSHSLSPDEIMKNSLANFAFENFEVATYKALITMVKAAGFEAAVPMLQESLKEELAMVAFPDETMLIVIRKFLALRSQGKQASH